MRDFSKYGLSTPQILLPDAKTPLARWAVIACDQHTSEPDYWAQAEALAGDNPSTLRLIHPECYLDRAAVDIPAIHACMAAYQKDVLTRTISGFVLVERQTTRGTRLGLVAALDLEAYGYAPGATPLVRSTEDTVVDRLPPRVAIRRGAPLDLPHVMVLANDPEHTLIEPIYAARDSLPALYDFDLMLSGGHIRGWAVEDDAMFDRAADALEALYAACGGFLFAVGDGNHSLAAARDCWLQAREALPQAVRATHPARYALVELVNLYDPALVFEPIHRAVFGADGAVLTHDFILHCRARGMGVVPCEPERAHLWMLDEPLRIENAMDALPVAVLQPFLDAWVEAHPDARIDYIHGEDALLGLQAVRIRLMPMDKRALFPAVAQGGALPRKTFSMGEAQDKRYYLESRSLY